MQMTLNPDGKQARSATATTGTLTAIIIAGAFIPAIIVFARTLAMASTATTAVSMDMTVI